MKSKEGKSGNLIESSVPNNGMSVPKYGMSVPKYGTEILIA